VTALLFIAVIAGAFLYVYTARRRGRECCLHCGETQPRRAVYKAADGCWYCDDGADCQARADAAQAAVAAGHAEDLARYAVTPASGPARPALHPVVGEFLAAGGRYVVRVQFSGENYVWWLGPDGQYTLLVNNAHRGRADQAERLADCIQLWNPGSTALAVMG